MCWYPRLTFRAEAAAPCRYVCTPFPFPKHRAAPRSHVFTITHTQTASAGISLYSLESSCLFESLFQETPSLKHLWRTPRETESSRFKSDWGKKCKRTFPEKGEPFLHLRASFSRCQESHQQSRATNKRQHKLRMGNM